MQTKRDKTTISITKLRRTIQYKKKTNESTKLMCVSVFEKIVQLTMYVIHDGEKINYLKCRPIIADIYF